MDRLKYILSLVMVVSSMLVSCDKYNTDVMGEDFAPYNSLVTRYRQLVYVEYQLGSAKVWGPYADEIDWSAEGTEVSIVSDLDSLVVITYGNAKGDEEFPLEGSLTVNSSQSFALYLTGLHINSKDGVAIYSKGKDDCYVVLPDKTNNHLIGSLVTEGPLIIDGRGSLDIKAHDDALVVKDGMTCSYGVKVNLESETGNGLRSLHNDIKIAEGTWTIKAADNALLCDDGQVVVNGGSIFASVRDGGFASAAKGVVANQSTCVAFAPSPSDLAESQRQFIWQSQVDTLSVVANEPVTINVTPNTAVKANKLATITPQFDYKTPWVFVTSPLLDQSDWVSISK